MSNIQFQKIELAFEKLDYFLEENDTLINNDKINKLDEIIKLLEEGLGERS